MKKILLFIFYSLLGYNSYAQSGGCGTKVTPAQIEYLKKYQNIDYKAKLLALKNNQKKKINTMIGIPVKIHIVRKKDHTGGISEKAIRIALDTVNKYYQKANLQFFICGLPNYIDDDVFYNFDSNQETDLVDANPKKNYIDSTINIYFVNDLKQKGVDICGYAPMPFKEPEKKVFTKYFNRIFIEDSCVASGNTLAHEIGHYFSLYHTHGKGEGINGTTDELANESNCNTAGDDLCDTPADPNLSLNKVLWVDPDCHYTGNFLDANNQAYSPNTHNIMAYSGDCRNMFTEQQYARMALCYQTDRNYLKLACDVFPNNCGAEAKFTLDCNKICNGGDCQFTLNCNDLGYYPPNLDKAALDSLIEVVDVEEKTAIPLDNQAANLFPNPFENQLNVDLTLAETTPIKVEVYDLQGKLVLQYQKVGEVGKNMISLDSSKLPSGLYVVKLNAHVQKIYRIIKL